MSDSIFTKIKNKEIPGNIVHEDDICFAIEDINPQAPVHVLIIPHKEIDKVSNASVVDISILGHLIYVSKKIAAKYKRQKPHILLRSWPITKYSNKKCKECY